MAAPSAMHAPVMPPAPPPSPQGGSSDRPRRSLAEAHVGTGGFLEAKVFAYVYLREAVHAPHLFVRRAKEQACGAPVFQLAASPRVVGVMKFSSPEEREAIVALSPVGFEGNTITIERHEEANNRFYAFNRVYAEVAVVNFPLEH